MYICLCSAHTKTRCTVCPNSIDYYQRHLLINCVDVDSLIKIYVFIFVLFFFLFLHLMILVGIANVIYAIYWILFILFQIGNKMWFCFYLHVVSLILLFEPRLWSNSKTLHVVLGLECRCWSIVRFDGAQLDGGKLCRAETKNWRRRTDIGLVNISGHHHECV